ncbi:MAG: hypothetical protein RL563_1504 [Pseudomonadota bacterium]
MKIHVIDDSGEVASMLLMAEADIAFYEDEIQALQAMQRIKPSVLLLSFNNQQQKTPAYIRALLEISPSTHIVVIGDDVSEDMICECLLAGACGYQKKSQLNLYFKKMISVVVDGEAWVSRKLVAHLLDNLRRQKQPDLWMTMA